MHLLLETTLGYTPKAINNLNGGSFQQDALACSHGWQYAAFYRDNQPGRRHVFLARRELSTDLRSWDVLEFNDYDQTEDDGHNVISLGISPSDGTIHLSFDNHDTPINYRHSLVDLTRAPSKATWSVESFSPVLHALPRLEHLEAKTYFDDVTYPRFLSLPKGNALLLSYRVGISGLGKDLIFIYVPTPTPHWEARGVFLQGVQNNAYVNGIDFDGEGALHVSWTWRDYVPVTLEQSRQQAGPNGPENNHDLCFARSPVDTDGLPGQVWLNAQGRELGRSGERPILPSTEGINAFRIPKRSGILNQEAQCVDAKGGTHILNRELILGVERWIHYALDRASTSWSRDPLDILPPSDRSARGKIFEDPRSKQIYILLPLLQELVVMARTRADAPWEEVFRLAGAGENEVLYDRSRLNEGDGVLSLFFAKFAGATEAEGPVIKVMDFRLC